MYRVIAWVCGVEFGLVCFGGLQLLIVETQAKLVSCSRKAGLIVPCLALLSSYCCMFCVQPVSFNKVGVLFISCVCGPYSLIMQPLSSTR